MPSGKKLTKADKEKRRREEEERRRVQEEEDRIRQEQEDRERRKREKIEAEERKKRDKEEMKVRVVELAELRAMLGSYHASEEAHTSEQRRLKRWNRYLRCDGTPDPTVLPQINTFLLVWRDDTKRVLIDDVMQDATMCLDLIHELEEHLDEGKAELEQKVVQQYRDTASDLQQLLQQKLSRAIYEMLRQGVNLADSETANLQSVWRSTNVTLCLWGNISKNPRIRSFEFSEAGISFDIPKSLTKFGCAYQFLLTDFDHYSPQSASYRAVPVAPPQQEQPPAEDEEEKKEEEAEQEEQPPQEEEEPVAREPTLDLMAELHRADAEEGDAEQEQEQEEEEEEVEPPEEDQRSSPPPTEFEDFDGEEDAMDLRGYHTLGPIINFNILQIPAQPLERRGWSIVQHQDPPQPISFDYRPDPIVRKEPGEAEERDSNPASDANSQQLAPGKKQQQQQPEEENPPITVSYQLPADVFFAEEPKVAHWDAERREWRTDGIEVTKFDEQQRQLQFRTSVFGTLSLLQDFHINMPFQAWEMRPQGNRSCQLNIIASINEVSLMVKEDRVCVAPHAKEAAVGDDAEAALGRVELQHLEEKWTTVSELVSNLRAAGVNLFPREDSFKHVDVPDKSSIAEEMLYEQMALLSPAFAFSWSRWNAEKQDRDTLLLQACEHLSDSPVNEDSYDLYSFTRRHARRLKMKEFDEEFSEELDDSVQFHADFYHLFQEVATDEAKARVADVDFRYLATVRQLLHATRPIVFA